MQKSMLKKYQILICSAALLLLMPFTLQAETKIGFVNAARVLEESPQADAARKKLEKEFAPRDEEIVAMQKDLKELEEKLSRDGAIMSRSEQRNLERDVLSQKREIKRKKEEFREDLNIRRNEAFERLRKRVFEVIVAIAEQKKFDLIVSDGVVFASKRIDITDEVVEQLQSEMPEQK
ncbi:MAG: OmpH family outer membrane protein [Gammaproteobacteria bacterium]|jgi:outer membrane protein